ncbi:phosphotransferase [Streptomyces sp900116325]|uniref:phosphotransferase n=1 Tax=Streptomyces sp. 900116325 TaxID=3154295 RepID=UPI0033D08349
MDALLAIGSETARVPGWRAALADSEIGLGPVEAGLAALATLAPYLPDERRMIHGDPLSHNVLAVGGTVTAVLDWGNALYGDHLYDAAWLIYWWPWCPQWRTIDIHAELLAHWHATGPPRPTCANASTPTSSTSASTPSLLHLPTLLGRGAAQRRHRSRAGQQRAGRDRLNAPMIGRRECNHPRPNGRGLRRPARSTFTVTAAQASDVGDRRPDRSGDFAVRLMPELGR